MKLKHADRRLYRDSDGMLQACGIDMFGLCRRIDQIVDYLNYCISKGALPEMPDYIGEKYDVPEEELLLP